MDQVKLGQYLSRRREDLGLTQDQLAQAVRVTRPYITQIENGKRTPSDEITNRILVALQIPIAQFVLDMAQGDVPQDKLDSLLVLAQTSDALQRLVGPDVMAQVMAAMPAPGQMDAALATLGGIELPPAPEGWLELSKTDRALVQRLINRLRKTNKERDDGDE